MDRLLVIRGGALGDGLLTFPALAALQGAFPMAKLDMIGYRHINALARSGGYVEGVYSLESATLARFFGRGCELDSEWCERFALYDCILSYLYDPDGIFEGNLRRAGARQVVSWDPRPAEGIHAAKWLLRGLEPLGVVGARPWVRMGLRPEDEAAAKDRVGDAPYIALHPGSGSRAKNWPSAAWCQLIDALKAAGHRVVVVGGEADAEVLAGMPSGIRVVVSAPLPEVAAILARASVFIGHDSGPGHLAAAVGTPSVLLFGPSDPSMWAPLNPWVRVLRAADGDLGNIFLPEVLAAVNDLMACPP